MSRIHAITGLGGLAALAVFLLGPAAEGPAGTSGAEVTAAAAEDAAAPSAPVPDAIRVFLDPETGQLLKRPVPGAVELERPGEAPGVRHWLNTYGDDLLQEALPKGGFMVDLRGRFRTALVATIDPETGEVDTDCVVSAAKAGEAGDER